MRLQPRTIKNLEITDTDRMTQTQNTRCFCYSCCLSQTPASHLHHHHWLCANR